MALQEATTLSRAVKEHGRRRGQSEGFSIAPGDCLAFKYYRDVSRPHPRTFCPADLVSTLGIELLDLVCMTCTGMT